MENFKFRGGLEIRRPDRAVQAPTEDPNLIIDDYASNPAATVGNNAVEPVIDKSYQTNIGNDFPQRAAPLEKIYDERNPWNTYDPSRGQSVQDFLTDNLMRQYDGGLSQYWQGEGAGSPRANAAYMAQLLAGSGITSLADVGYKDDWVNPDRVGQAKWEMVGGGIDQGDRISGYVTPEEAMERIIINKNTGERINGNYDRTRGNTWGGTFAGKGNTGYDVQFDKNGRAYFGSHAESSNQNEMNLLKMAGFVASGAFPMLAPYIGLANAGYAYSQGDKLGALASALGAGAGIGGQFGMDSGVTQALSGAGKAISTGSKIYNMFDDGPEAPQRQASAPVPQQASTSLPDYTYKEPGLDSYYQDYQGGYGA